LSLAQLLGSRFLLIEAASSPERTSGRLPRRAPLRRNTPASSVRRPQSL